MRGRGFVALDIEGYPVGAEEGSTEGWGSCGTVLAKEGQAMGEDGPTYVDRFGRQA